MMRPSGATSLWIACRLINASASRPEPGGNRHFVLFARSSAFRGTAECLVPYPRPLLPHCTPPRPDPDCHCKRCSSIFKCPNPGVNILLRVEQVVRSVSLRRRRDQLHQSTRAFVRVRSRVPVRFRLDHRANQCRVHVVPFRGFSYEFFRSVPVNAQGQSVRPVKDDSPGK